LFDISHSFAAFTTRFFMPRCGVTAPRFITPMITLTMPPPLLIAAAATIDALMILSPLITLLRHAYATTMLTPLSEGWLLFCRRGA